MTNIAGSETKDCIQSLIDHRVHELMMDIITRDMTEENHETAIWFIGNICVDAPQVKTQVTENGILKRIAELLLNRKNCNDTVASLEGVLGVQPNPQI